MIILGIDSSSVSACCGVAVDGKTVAQGFVNNGLTHSQTLLPLIAETCEKADIKPQDIDLVCITKGPGSFTGLRIGMATLKGMAAPFDTKCVGVSTLEAVAATAVQYDYNGIICAVLDARCKQVYNAIFKAENGRLTRICEDRALAIEELEKELSEYSEPIFLCGDGAVLCENSFEKVTAKAVAEEAMFIKGSAVCSLGETYRETGVSADKINPVYLRLPQAQRELLKKKEVLK